MNVCTDARIFNLTGAVEKLPSLPTDEKQPQTAKVTGTHDASAIIVRSETVSGQQAGIGNCSAVIGSMSTHNQSAISLVTGGNGNKNPRPAGTGKNSG